MAVVPDPAAPPPAAALPAAGVPTGDLEAVVAVVLAHPAVARLDGGPFGAVASYLPGRRRLLGVRIGAPGESTAVAVVVRGAPVLADVAAELGAAVRGVLGPVPVEVTFTDVVPGEVPDRARGPLA